MVEVEQMFSDLGETPFEPLKEQPNEGMHIETIVEMQITTINESLFSFFKQGIVITTRVNPFGSKPSKTCYIYIAINHIAVTCPKIGDLRFKWAKCGLSHTLWHIYFDTNIFHMFKFVTVSWTFFKIKLALVSFSLKLMQYIWMNKNNPRCDVHMYHKKK